MRTWLWQIVTIENKGFDAFIAGKPESACPYGSVGSGGSVQRQRQAAWHRGWKLAKAKHGEFSKGLKNGS